MKSINRQAEETMLKVNRWGRLKHADEVNSVIGKYGVDTLDTSEMIQRCRVEQEGHVEHLFIDGVKRLSWVRNTDRTLQGSIRYKEYPCPEYDPFAPIQCDCVGKVEPTNKKKMTYHEFGIALQFYVSIAAIIVMLVLIAKMLMSGYY